MNKRKGEENNIKFIKKLMNEIKWQLWYRGSMILYILLYIALCIINAIIIGVTIGVIIRGEGFWEVLSLLLKRLHMLL